MCKNIEEEIIEDIFQKEEQPEEPEEPEEIPFPTHFQPNEILYGCSRCGYPILKKSNVRVVLSTFEVYNVVVGIVTKTKYLYTEYFSGPLDIERNHWQRIILCFCCNSLLSFTPLNIRENIRNYQSSEKIEILNFDNLKYMSAANLEIYFNQQRSSTN